jgi:hypothetical protein
MKPMCVASHRILPNVRKRYALTIILNLFMKPMCVVSHRILSNVRKGYALTIILNLLNPSGYYTYRHA